MNEDTRESIEGSLCMGLAVLLAVLLLGLSGCDQIAAGGINPAVAAEVAVEAERLKLESDNQPVLPDDLGGAKDVVPETRAPQTRRVLCFTDPPSCAPCVRQEAEFDAMRRAGWNISTAEGQQVRIINLREHRDWHQKYQVQALPTFVLLVDGKEVDRTEGFMNSWGIAALFNPKPWHQSAPEVANQRPFAESWRQELARKHGRRAMGAHTDLDAETVALPETRINIRQQCVEFSGPSRVSQLNRWFSVSFGAGNVSHSGSTVEFSNPPELRFHLFAGGNGEKLDSLKAIEFTSDGAAFRMTRFGTIHFKVK